MKKLMYLFIFVLILNLKGFSQEIFKDEASGIQVTVPAGWYYETKDNTILFYPEDKDFYVSLATHEVESAEKLVKELFDELSKSYTDIKMDDPKDDEQNGMKGWSLTGTAKTKDGVDVIIVYGMYATPKDKILELGAVGTQDIIKKYEKQIDVIDKSIKPIENKE
jgi:hypothetical protein